MHPIEDAPPQTFSVNRSDFKELQRLRNSCRLALERYVDVASEASGQIIRLSPAAVDDPLTLLRVNLLRQKEQKALGAYESAKGKLLEFVLGGDRLPS
jgi:hypothetical protein